jgi:metallophosphoesterase superfamily enzyme
MQKFTFSTDKRYFILEERSQFSMVFLGDFKRFFSESFKLEEAQKEMFFELTKEDKEPEPSNDEEK